MIRFFLRPPVRRQSAFSVQPPSRDPTPNKLLFPPMPENQRQRGERTWDSLVQVGAFSYSAVKLPGGNAHGCAFQVSPGKDAR